MASSMIVGEERIRKLFRRATETGDWQFRFTAWLELDDACPCYYCYDVEQIRG